MNHPAKKTIPRIALNLRSLQTQVVLTLGVVGAYVLAFMLLYPFGGPGVAVLSLIPVTVAACFFGLRIGLLSGILSLLLNTLLLNLVGQKPGGLGMLFYTGGGIAGAIVNVAIGMIVGQLHDLSDQLKQQLAEREQTEISLRQSEEGQRQLVAVEREQRLLAETLGRVGLALNSTLELSELFNLICQESINLFQVGSAFIWLIQGEELVGYAGHGQGRENFLGMHLSISDTQALGPLVVRERHPIFVNEVTKSDLINPKLVKLFQVEAILGVPFFRENKVLGALMIIDTLKAQRFSQDDVKIAEALGNYAAIALQNAQLFETETHRRHEAEMLRQSTIALTSALDREDVLDNTLNQLEQVIPFDSACVFLRLEDKLKVVSAKGFADVNQVIGQVYPVDDALFEEMRRTRQPLLLPDAQADPRFQKWETSSHIRGWMGVPLTDHDKVIGYLTLDNQQVDAYNLTDTILVQTFANQAAVAIANAQLFEQTQLALVEAKALHHISSALIGLENLPSLLQTVAQEVAKTLPATWVALIRLDLKAQQVIDIAVGGPETTITRTNTFEELMGGLTGWVVREKKPALSPKGQPDPRESREVQQNRVEKHFGSIIVVPLRYQENILGTLTAVNRSDEPDFTQRDVNLMVAMANQAAVAIVNTQLFEQTQVALAQSEALYQATRTLITLTNLPEMLQSFVDRVAEMLPASRVSLYIIDRQTKQVIETVIGGPGADSFIPFSFDELWNGLTGWTLRELKPAISPKGQHDPRHSPAIHQRRIDTKVGAIVAVPLRYRDDVFGTMTAVNRMDEPDFTPQDIELMTVIANQAAIAIENARLFEATQKAHQLSDALREIEVSLTSTLDLEEVLNRILDGLGKVVPSTSTSIMLIEDNVLRIKAARGFPEDSPAWSQEFGIQEGSVDRDIYQHKKILIIPDVRQDPRFIKLKGTEYIRSWLGLPLIAHDEVIGTLNLDYNQPNFYTEEHAAIASAFARQAAIALENARLFDETQQRAEHLETLRQASLSLTASLELHSVLETILKSALDLTSKANSANIFLYQSDTLIFGAALSKDGPSDMPFSEPRRDGLTYTVARQGESMVVPDMGTHPLFIDAPFSWSGAIIGLPLKVSRRVVGVMNVASFQPQTWAEAELHALELLADQAAIAIENAWLYEKVQQHTAQLEAQVAERTFKLQALYELAHKLGHATQVSEVIRLTLLELYQTLPHDVAASLLLGSTTDILVIQSQHELTSHLEGQIQGTLLEAIAPLSDHVIDEKTLETHRIQPRVEDDLKPPLQHLGSVITAPILIGETGIGLLLVATQQEAQFNEEQKRLLYIVANQAADTIGRLQSLLAAEHQRLENLVAHLPSGIIMLNFEQQIVLANPLAQKLMSNLTTAHVGNRLTQLDEYSIKMILDSTSTETPLTIAPKELPGQLIEVVAKPITTGLETGGWILVLRDVTEERAIQRQIQQQERMAAVGQLAAGVAHDFNNILTSIIGHAELLLLDPSLSHSAKGDVERVTKQGQRAAHLVRQILDFSRQTISAKQSLNLYPLIQETIKLLERTIREDIHISLDVEPGGYTILGDLTQIQQALTNMAVNARDAMPTGGNLTFQLSRFVLHPGEEPPFADLSPGDWIALAISDTGMGIPAELQQKIFEPFFTTKEVGEGTGLGLAQVYGIMRQHDGYINVKSQPEIGTTFSLYFPALLLPESSSQEVDMELPRGGNELILLVEDDESVLTITTNMLQHLGYRVISASDGYEALEIYDEHQSEIALVLTDMTMPEMGGAELTSALRERNPAIKVIVLTGYPLEATGKAALTQGIVAWLQKPLSMQNLADTISQSLSLKEETF